MNISLLKDLGLQGITSPLGQCDPVDIETFERTLRAKIPLDYKKFLLGYAPSLFAEDVAFEPVECSPWAVDGLETMDIFYGISSDAGFDIRSVNKRLRGNIPKGMIAIGHDAGSNLILLSLDDLAVRFFDKESGTTTLVAPTFADFLNSFKKR